MRRRVEKSKDLVDAGMWRASQRYLRKYVACSRRSLGHAVTLGHVGTMTLNVVLGNAHELRLSNGPRTGLLDVVSDAQFQ